jgi:hypothetical protein
MLLFDDRIRAVVVGPDLSIARVMTGRSLLRPSLVIRWPDSVVMNGPIGTEESFGYPLHYASFTAYNVKVIRSFGGEGERLPKFSLPLESFQTVAIARDGELWTSSLLEYEIRKLRRSGGDALILKRAPSWFAERSRPWLGNHEYPPPPRMFGIREDSHGLLWVFVQVASPGWNGAWARVPKGMKDVPASLVDFEKFFDTLVEVIDPAVGRVVARRRIGSRTIALPGSGHNVAIYRVDDDGEPSVRIVALSLAGRR